MTVMVMDEFVFMAWRVVYDCIMRWNIAFHYCMSRVIACPLSLLTVGPEFNRDCWFSEKFSLGLDFPNVSETYVSNQGTILKFCRRVRIHTVLISCLQTTTETCNDSESYGMPSTGWQFLMVWAGWPISQTVILIDSYFGNRFNNEHIL